MGRERPDPAPPTPPRAKGRSSVIVKGHNSDLTSDNALSLFIFSDNEEHQQEARDEIALRIENFLGPARVDVSREQLVERNRKDYGDGQYVGGALNPLNWLH